MTTAVFSTVDRLTSRFKPIDRLINTVAARLLPQHDARGFTCPIRNTYLCATRCGDFCNPTSDIRYSTIGSCCDVACESCVDFRVGCDDCG